MHEFVILPHTSELRLKVFGDTRQELFTAAVEGMNSVIKEEFSPDKSLMNYRDVIEVSSKDISMLLIDFLSELLTLSHQYKAVFHDVMFQEFTETKIIAHVEGDGVDGFDEDIKAVTYTEANIIKNRQGQYETMIVFDI